MIALQVERVADCWEDVYPLTRRHWEGTKSYRRHEPFSPSKSRYIHYNEIGFFHLITARDAGRLVGYFGVYVSQSMHSGLLTATEDTFFIHPDYRQGRLALRILRYVEAYLTVLGVHEVLFSCEIDNDSGIQALLTRFMKFEPVITQFRKVLSTSADSASTEKEGVGHATP